MPSAAALLAVALLCKQAQDVVGQDGVSSATSGTRGTRGRTQVVSVSAPWPTSPLSPLAEASEFVAEGGGRLFWDFVEALGDAPHSVFCPPPPSACSGSTYSSSVGDAAATAGEGDSRHGSPREPAAASVVDASQPQQQGFAPPAGDEAARLAADAAVTAASHGFGGGATASGGGGTPVVGLDALSLRLLEVALSARAHAPAVESHRTLAAPTRSVCPQDAATADPPSPGAWVVFLPSGDVVCSPKDLDLSPETCSVAPAAGGDGAGAAAGEAQACRAPRPPPAPATSGAEDGGPPGSGASSGGTLAFDHVYPSRSGGGSGGSGGSGGGRGSGPGNGGAGPTTTAVLYGVVGSPAMMDFHRVLKAAAEAGTVRYAFRHALPYGGGEGDGDGVMETATTTTAMTTPLQGYGVVLDIKNMEYQSFDSSDSENEGGGEGGKDAATSAVDDALSIVDGEEVGGVVFSTVAARRPELKRELGILRQALLLEEQAGDGGGNGGSEELKVWNMGDLGLQALQSVAGAENPLLRLEELSQNFPSHASALSALKVQSGTREEAQAAAYYFSKALGLRPGSLYVNGKMVDLEGPTFNVFQILSMLRAEAVKVGELGRIRAPMGALSGDRGRSLLASSGPLADPDSGGGGAGGRGMGAGSGNWRVDIVGPKKKSSKDKDKQKALPSSSSTSSSSTSSASGAIAWLNDIEADEAYKNWPPSLQQLLYGMNFQMPRVRKNLCNLVVVVDPTTPAGAEAMQLLGMVVEQGLPVRVGLLLVSEADLDAVEEAAGGEDERGAGRQGEAGGAGVGDDDDDDGDNEGGGDSRPPQAREIAELVARLAEYAGSQAVTKFVGEVGAALAAGGDGFSRRVLADTFRKASSSTRGVLHESLASAEPWTKEGALWGTGEGEGGGSEKAQPLPRARAMARLCLSKGLPVQSWSINGLSMGGLADIRGSLMQGVMQEHHLIGQLYQQGLVTDKTRDVYSRVLKHSGDRIRASIHPAFTESLEDARVSDLSSPEAVELMFGTSEGGNGVALCPPFRGVDWLHPPGSSDHAKGVSIVAVVDPTSRKGLGALEEALSLLLSGGDDKRVDGNDGGNENVVSDGDSNGDGSGGNSGSGGGGGPESDPALPGSGVRLAVVFNPPAGEEEAEKGGGEGRGEGGAGAGRWLPAVFEAVGSRAPDKAPGFLLSLTKAAVSPNPEGPATAADVVNTVAREAGLSPSLRAAVVEAAAAPGEAAEVVRRRATLVRHVTGIGNGESCAFVNGRKALSAREGRALTAADLSIAVGAADELGDFLRGLALGWDWGSWPEGSPESLDPDMVGAQLQSNVISQLASFLWRYHQENRRSIPGPDELSQLLVDAMDAAVERAAQFGGANTINTGGDSGSKGTSGVISVLRLEPDGRLRRSQGGAGLDSAVDHDGGDGLDEEDGEEEGIRAAGAAAAESEEVEGVEEEEKQEGSGVNELGDVAVELVAVLDPLSMAAQRASTLLSLAQDVLGLPVTLLLVPALDVSELPLKNFYRLVLGPASGSVASFEGLPTRDTLTQRLDTPEPWNVQASAALQDLDNLRCDDSGCGDNGTSTTSAEYTLKGLLLTGRCYDVTSGAPSPPQGLQLVLRASSSSSHLSLAQGKPSAVVADTVVMENLGYFQLQAGPGLWELALAKGRASEVYEIIGDSSGEGGGGRISGAAHAAAYEVTRRLQRELSGEGKEPGAVSPATESQAIAVRNFYSRYEPVLVRKRAGMEDVGLLEPDTTDDAEKQDAKTNTKPQAGDEDTGYPSPIAKSVWSSVSAAVESARGLVGLAVSEDGEGDGEGEGQGNELRSPTSEGEGGVEGEDGRGLESLDDGREVVVVVDEEEEGERLHVFSLATGHLYERFLKVMMMSVVKRASLPVTFWLLENFLSSSFKDSAQALAQEFGFRVKFVTYKWPEWLRRQSEKQRIIWGYKILFLDVLFPLNVDKVIYVDADQVVRADLKELWDLDLQGAPYGYTPFCSSREETLGYQFWRGGFWQTHLMGRPYHISALYVVDLKAFRRMAVGDSLRSIYNSLSQDPNSLSNLDQDLPNYAQIKVPIFSLPQEWLWCESWCSDASKAEAKTIDLCNNPQHKEPKLDMAKRVISGPLFEESWVELDAEVRTAEEARLARGA
eukprot:g17633.t1